MKKIIKVFMSFVFVSAMCITSLQLPILAQDPIIEEPVQSEVESQTLNLQDQIQEPTLINEFSYVNLNESIIKKTLSDEEKQNKTDEEIIALEKQLGYEFKKIDLEASYTKTQLIEVLPKTIKAQTDSKEIEIPITWKLDNIEEEIKDGIYTLTPTIPEDYKLSNTISNHDIELTVSYKKVEEDMKDANVSNLGEKLSEEALINDSTKIVSNFKIQWLDYPDDKNIDVNVERNDNSYKVEMELSFNVKAIKAKELEIRLPMQLYKNRHGEKQGTYDINAGYDGHIYNTDLYYYKDNETQELVIYNSEDITDEKAYKVQIAYSDSKTYGASDFSYPSEIINGSKHSLQASYQIITKDGNHIEKDKSNELTVTHNISTTMNEVKIQKESRVFTWNSEWGEEPENSKDYFYITWDVSVTLSWYYPDPTFKKDAYSMPFKLKLHAEQSHEGEIIKWIPYDFSGKFLEEEFTADNNNDLLLSVERPRGGTGPISVKSHLVVAYPLDSIKDENNRTIEERIQAIFKPYYEEDGEEATILEKIANYKYEDLVFEYSDGNYGIKKEKSNDLVDEVKGAINKLEKLKDGEKFPLLEYKDSTFKNIATVEAGDLTLEGSETDINNYEKKKYTTEIIDDLIILNNGEDSIRLNESEYNFSKVKLSEIKLYTNKLNEDTGGVSYEQIYDVSQIDPIKISYAKDLNGRIWVDYATITLKDFNGECEVKYQSGETKNMPTPLLELPDDAVAIKSTTTTKKAQISINMEVAMNLKGSERLRQFVNGKEIIELTNVNTLEIKNENGIWINPKQKDSILGSLKQFVIERDESVYGNQYAQHNQALIKLESVKKTTQPIKEMNKINKGEEGYFQYHCIVGAYMGFRDSNILSEHEARELGIVEEEKSAFIYDLLPMGTYIEEKTIKGGKIEPYESGQFTKYRFIEIPQAQTYVQYKKNWRGSGRTLAVFKVTLPDNLDNVDFLKLGNFQIKNYLISGLAVDFDLIYPNDYITEYGRELRNLAVYQSQNDLSQYTYAYPDDPADYSYYEEQEREWLKDIDDDGIWGDEAPINTLYTHVEKTIVDLISSEIGISKMVMASHDSNYKKDTSVLPGEDYSYRIRFGKTDGSTSKNIIIYDVLETAFKENEKHWKGVFDSIDLTSLDSKDVNPIVYYSTLDNISLSEDMIKNNKDNADLNNTNIWTKTRPEDKTKIKAIAVDLSKTKSGAEFVLKEDEKINFVINMKAPNTGIDELEKNDVKSYNEAWVSNKFSLENSQDTNEGLLCTRTEVSIRNPDLTIEKTSDPITGTAESPTEVSNKQKLIYKVFVNNKEYSIPLKNIVVEDEIPSGLEIRTDDIRYYLDDDIENKKPVNIDEVVTLVSEGQKLTFTVKELKPRQEIHFEIPTVVKETNESTRYENTAYIKKIDTVDVDIPSETTYHEKIGETYFEFTKTDKSGNQLSGAYFVMFQKNCDQEHNAELLEVDSEGNLIDSNQEKCWTKVGKTILEPGSATKEFMGLRPDKEYRLVEYKAPDNFLKPVGQWILKYDEETKMLKVVSSIGNPPAFKERKDADPKKTLYELPNYKIEELPTTGGRGILRFMLIGTPIMMIGGYLIIRNKKKA